MRNSPGNQLAILFLCLGLLASGTLLAVEKVRVVALFSNKAMIEVDGKRHFIKAGQASPEGVLLVSATTEEAVLEVDGRRDSYKLGSVVGGNFAKRKMAEVKISRDNRGAFMTVGSINGRMTDMMVDTGATIIAMSEVEAKRLGIQYRLEGKPIMASTASGVANGYMLKLDNVRVGEIELTQVEAMIIQGSSPTEVLLGMSFLKRVKIINKDNLLILQAKF